MCQPHSLEQLCLSVIRETNQFDCLIKDPRYSDWIDQFRYCTGCNKLKLGKFQDWDYVAKYCESCYRRRSIDLIISQVFSSISRPIEEKDYIRVKEFYFKYKGDIVETIIELTCSL
jgi:hypothetical protein